MTSNLIPNTYRRMNPPRPTKTIHFRMTVCLRFENRPKPGSNTGTSLLRNTERGLVFLFSPYIALNSPNRLIDQVNHFGGLDVKVIRQFVLGCRLKEIQSVAVPTQERRRHD